MRKSLKTTFLLSALGLLFVAAISNSPLVHSVVVAPAIPTHMSLAGEEVPMGDFGVREALDRELIINT